MVPPCGSVVPAGIRPGTSSEPLAGQTRRMHVCSVDRISKAYPGGDGPLFSGVRFGLTTDDRVGVVGPNGAGKSTLLRIVAGVEDPDDGRVVFARDARVAVLDQDPAFDPAEHALDAVLRLALSTASSAASSAASSIAGASDDATQVDAGRSELRSDLEVAARSVLDRLGVTDPDAPMGTLSGGLRRRVALAAALAQPTDLLVLDEPTNHLDADAVDWLESHLQRRPGGLLMVTHDRWFLERVCNRIVVVDAGTFASHDGGWAVYTEDRARRAELAGRTERRRRNLARKELAWLRRGAKARTSKPKFRLEQAATLLADGPADDDGTLQLGTGRRRLGRTGIECDAATVRFGERTVLRDVSLLLGAGDRIGVVGPNGAGKTTLLRLLAGELPPVTGAARHGSTVVCGFYRQDATVPDDDRSVLDAVTDVAAHVPLADGTTVPASRMCERFGFDAALQRRSVRLLSGGERRRLALLRVLMDAPNVLFLDEPTNDLDLDTLTALEDHLDGFGGVLVVASHDRFLLDRCTDRYLAVDTDGGVREIVGDWDAYRDAVRAAAVTRRERGASTVARDGSERRTPRPGRLSFGQKRELSELEARIADLTGRIGSLRDTLGAPGAGHDAVAVAAAELASVESELTEAEDRWLELSTIADR
jgi:ATP-binding cassette subfamily F protein uup